MTLFGAIALPRLVDQDSPLTGAAAQTHEAVATIILILVGIHALAALRHRFVLKDEVLQRMLPSGGP